MHELIYSNRLIEEAKQFGDVKKIIIEVGELANITAKELEKTLRLLTKWEVEVLKKDSKVKCKCGYEGEAEIIDRSHSSVIYNCPKCGGLPKVLSGSKIILKRVECV